MNKLFGLLQITLLSVAISAAAKDRISPGSFPPSPQPTEFEILKVVLSSTALAKSFENVIADKLIYFHVIPSDWRTATPMQVDLRIGVNVGEKAYSLQDRCATLDEFDIPSRDSIEVTGGYVEVRVKNQACAGRPKHSNHR